MAAINGPAVQALREQAGISARELGRRVKVDHSTIRRVERGGSRAHVRLIGLEHSIAAALGVDVSQVLMPGEQASFDVSHPDYVRWCDRIEVHVWRSDDPVDSVWSYLAALRHFGFTIIPPASQEA